MKKSVSIFFWSVMSLLMVMTNCLGSSFKVFAQEDSTTKIMTSLKVVGRTPDELAADGTGIYNFNTGSLVNLYANFEVSGTQVNIDNATVKIWLPKDEKNYIQTVHFTGSYNATSVTFSGDNDPNEFSVSYFFKHLRGGMLGGYPFSFRFENLITPPDVEQPVYFSIYDEDGNLVYNKEEKVMIRSKAVTKYDAVSYVGSKYQKSTQIRLHPDYLSTNPPATTPSDSTATQVTFLNQFLPLGSGTGSAEGEYRSHKVRVVDHLPDGAVFIEDNATNIKYGWKKVDDHTYETVLDKSNPDHAGIFESEEFVIPIVLGFPNVPLEGIPVEDKNAPGVMTDSFENRADFYYYTLDNGQENEVQVNATDDATKTSFFFFYKMYIETRPVETDYTWNRQIVNGRENFVNISENPDEVSILNGNTEKNITHVPLMDFTNVFPENNPERPVWKATTDVHQYTKEGFSYKGESLKRVLDRIGQIHPHFSTGYTDEGVYANKNTNLTILNSARFYYQDMIIKADANTNSTADKSNSLDALSQSKFWVFKTFGNRVTSYYANASTDIYAQNNENTPTILVPVANHPFSLNEVIKINDEGGYYTGLTVIATDDLNSYEVAAIKRQSVIPWEQVMEEYKDGDRTKWRLKGLENNQGDEHSLLLKNVNLHQVVTYRPVKEGGKSITETNSVFVAPHSYDFLAKFNEDVLKAKNDNDSRTVPSNINYAIGFGAAIPPQNRNTKYYGFDQVEPRRYIDEAQNNTDTEHDTFYLFKPNNAKINLSVSDSKSYIYTDKDPEHVGSFASKIFDARRDLTARNIKGVVLLPPGIEYVSTESFGSALGEPDIIKNFKNTGRQAIVYSFGDVSVKADKEKSLGTVSYKVRLTKKTKDSASTQEGSPVETWMTWDNPSLVWASTERDGNGNASDDVMDLNQRGDTKDLLLKGKYDIFYFAPAEVLISKYASDGTGLDLTSGEKAGQWGAWAQDSRYVDVNGNVYFRMFLVNQHTKTIDNLTVVERMPALNDHKMVANEDGVYALKGPNDAQTGSFFPVYLTQKLGEFKPNQDLDLFDFEYTFAPILSDAPNPDAYAATDIVNEQDWIAEADLDNYLASQNKSMKDITGFRAILKKGKHISGISETQRPPYDVNPITFYQNNPQFGNTASIYVPGQLPFDTSLDRNISAYMSSAYKLATPDTDEYASYALNEGNEVRLNSMYYTISGTVFRDYQHTGQLNDNQIPNVKATLVFAQETTIDGQTYAAGAPVPSKYVRVGKLDKTKNEVVPVTDTPFMSRVARYVSGNMVANNEQGTSTMTDQDGNYYFVVYRRGHYRVKFETDANNPLQTFVQYGSTDGKDRANTVAPASLSPKTTETESVDFEVSPDTISYYDNGSINYLDGSLHRVANAAIDDQKRDLVIYKYGVNDDTDPQAQKVALSASFKLTDKNDPSVVYEFTTNEKSGEYRIEDLPYGTYVLQETKAPEGLLPLNNEMEIVVSDQGVTFDQANSEAGFYQFVDERVEVKNIVPKGSIRIVKSSSLNAESKLSGVVLGLYQNDQPVLDGTGTPIQKTTDEDGVVIFDNLPAGTVYTIKEEQSLEGYSTKWQVSENEVVDLSQGTDVKLPMADQAKVELVLNNIPNQATIKVKKSDDAGLPLANAQFSLYRQDQTDTAIQTVTTNEKGIGTFDNVYSGTYVVRETQGPEGYVPSDQSYVVKVTQEGATYWVPRLGVSVVNKQIKGKVQFTKVDEQGNGLAGATFKLYKDDTLVASKTTDSTGLVEWSDLPYGTYVLKETSAPEGYVALADQSFKIETDGQIVQLGQKGQLMNQKIRGQIEFTKVDADAYHQNPSVIQPLANVTFKLYRAKLENGSYVKDGDAVQTVTTQTDGVVRFEQVLAGHYVIEEDSPAVGYNSSSASLHVQITENGKTVIPTEDGYFTNQVIKGSVSFKKTDDAGKPLAGAKFKLANAQRSYEVVSNQEGLVEFKDVVYGSYTLTEVSAPTGYLAWTGSQTVKIETEGQKLELDTIENELIQSSIRIQKTSFLENLPVEKAKFKLYQDLDDQGQPIHPVQRDGQDYEVTTDDKGVALFEAVPYGTYYVQESSAPEGYLVSDEIKEVKVLEKRSNPYVLELTNRKIRGRIELTKEDGQDQSVLEGAEFKLYQVKLEDGQEVVGKPFEEAGSDFVVETNQKGQAVFKDVLYGDYFVKETKAPEGYVLSDKAYKVSIRKQGESVQLKIANEKQRGNLKIVKTSSDGKVEGFTFRIEDSQNKIIERKTDKNGVILLENLVVGRYRISEVADQASEGYERPADVVVEVSYNMETEVRMHNVKKPVVIKKRIQTGSQLNLEGPLLALAGSVIILGLLIWRMRRARG